MSHLSLFNEPTFISLNLRNGQQYHCIDTKFDSGLVGSTAGVVVDDEFISGYSAPFGGPDFVRKAETIERVNAVIFDLVVAMQNQQWKSVRINAKPSSYSMSEVPLQISLLNNGFSLEAWEISHSIHIERFARIEDYDAELRPTARKKLRHLEKEPFSFAEAVDDPDWFDCYQLLSKNRAAKGRKLKLSFDYILRIRDTFP